VPSNDGYGYQDEDDPLADGEKAEAKLPTSCARARCRPPEVCRLLSMRSPGGVAHAYCLGPDDDLCRLDPELCREEACRTNPGVCG
jgi:hypothetical protein